MSNLTTIITRSGNGRVFGMPASGSYAFPTAAIACLGTAARERHGADVVVTSAPKQHPGTQVWSPPT